jgi:hypothetical protein
MILDADNYHGKDANLAYFSNSQVSKLRECAAKTVAQLHGRWPDDEAGDALLIGSYVDGAILTPDTLAKWCEDHADDMRSPKTGKEYAWVTQARAMSVRAIRDDQFMNVLRGEHQVYITFDLFGHTFKAALDSVDVSRGYFADLKTCPSLSHTNWDNEVRKHAPWYDRYFQQVAVYWEAYKAKYGESPRCAFIAAVTKEVPPDIGIIMFDRSVHGVRMDYELDQVKANIDAWAAMKRGEIEPTACGSCDYCRATKKLTMDSVKVAKDVRYGF